MPETLNASQFRQTSSSRQHTAPHAAHYHHNTAFHALPQKSISAAFMHKQATAACVLIALGIRYGVYRLSLEKGSIETYDLVVKHGLNLMQPLLGSNQSHMEVSDKLYELSPKGQAPFADGSSVFFPAFNNHHLFRWLNDYYLAELKQSPNKKAEVSTFFLRATSN